MKKKMVAVMLVLGLTSVARASFLISVDGVVNPPDTSIEIGPSEHVQLGIHTDGQEHKEQLWLICEGSGMLQGPGVFNPNIDWSVAISTLYTLGDGSGICEWLADPGYTEGYPDVTSAIYPEMAPSYAGNLPAGMLIDQIPLLCTGYGDVVISFVRGDLEVVFDTQIIHQTPEPMPMGLLALGGLTLLRRRR